MISLLGIHLAVGRDMIYELAIMSGVSVNLVLAALLLLDPENDYYSSVPRYIKSRRLTACSMLVFGIGFLLHLLFQPRQLGDMEASVLSLTYFHIGGVLFSMSHTELMTGRYLSTRVMLRDSLVALVAVALNWSAVFTGCVHLHQMATVIFLFHMMFLTVQFLHRFQYVYSVLGCYSEHKVNDSDRHLRFVFFSCYLIIFFGLLGGIEIMFFPGKVWVYMVMMLVSNVVFAYIYISLQNFSRYAFDVQQHLAEAEAYVDTDSGATEYYEYCRNQREKGGMLRSFLTSGFFKQW